MKLFVSFLIFLALFSERLFISAENRIAGGEEAQAGQFPWIGAIEYVEFSQVCAGSVLSDHWFLTAAHCVINLTPDSIYVRVGSRFRETGGQTHRIINSTIHPDFARGAAYDYDVAVCEVEGIMAGPGIRPIPLTRAEPNVGQRVFVSGWGATEQQGYPAEVLRFVNIPVISRESCNSSYNGLITDRMICASESGRDICSLDNGGPLIDTRNFLVGIVSWGMGCGIPLYPGVYTNIAHPEIRNFIEEITGL
ncbi:trypsin-3-like [Lutzomyia longipalpis]|uniref:trypsin-3-like n=1 Tax=Lutzomyia longipalpis TaxID=7200 RepID=UPI002483F5CD|nr:trypsin-3-like [Lutzomyia longipalpis]